MPRYLSARAQNRAQSPGGRLGRLLQTRPDDVAAITAAREDLVAARIMDVAERSIAEQGVLLRGEHVAMIVAFLTAHTSQSTESGAA